MRLVDLSNTVGPHWKWDAQLKPISSLASGDFAALSLLTVTTHDYTHVDAPAHMILDGTTLDKIDTDRFWGPAAVLDLQDVPRASLITKDLLAERGAHLAEGEIALLCTGLSSKIPNTSPEFWAASPYLDRDAAQWLVDRGAKCVGYDFSQEWTVRRMFDFEHGAAPLDHGDLKLEDWPVHEVLLSAGVIQVEHLTNLHALTQPRVLFFGLPLKLADADGGPVRAFAVEGVI